MSYLDRDVAPEGATRAPQRPVTAQRTPAGGSTPPMLDLQRLAGNAAVSQAIRDGQFDSTPVQRIPAATTESDTEDEMDEEDLEEGAEESETESETEDVEADLEEEEAEEEQEQYQEESG